jgi:hypothetical protein
VTGMRRARYRGLAKTHLQHVTSATAINLVRLHAGGGRAHVRRMGSTHRVLNDLESSHRPLRCELVAIKLWEASREVSWHVDARLSCLRPVALLYFAAVPPGQHHPRPLTDYEKLTQPRLSLGCAELGFRMMAEHLFVRLVLSVGINTRALRSEGHSFNDQIFRTDAIRGWSDRGPATFRLSPRSP